MTDYYSDPATFGGANATVVTAANSALTTAMPKIQGNPKFSNAHAPTDAFVYAITPSGSSAEYVGFDHTVIVDAAHSFSIAVDFFVSTANTSDQGIVNVRDDSDNGLFTVVRAGTGKIKVTNDVAGNVVGTTTTAAAAGSWYRLEINGTNGSGTSATDTLNVKLYTRSGTTPISGGSIAGAGLNLGGSTREVGGARFGCTTPSGNGNIEFAKPRFRTGATTEWGPVVAPAAPPVAVLTQKVWGRTAIVSSQSSTHATGATITKREWDFGDGTAVQSGDGNHQYVAAGAYTITLKVTDSLGGTDTDSIDVLAVDGQDVGYPVEVVNAPSFTAVGGDPIDVVTDTDPGSFLAGSGSYDVYISPMKRPAAGVPLTFVLRCDALPPTVTTADCQLYAINGTTLRASISGVSVQQFDDVSDGGQPGTGDATGGTVNRFVRLAFTPSQWAALTAMDWDRILRKVQFH